MMTADEINKLADDINRYFTSGNSVPVDRASIPAEKWNALYGALRDAAHGLSRRVPAVHAGEGVCVEMTIEQLEWLLRLIDLRAGIATHEAIHRSAPAHWLAEMAELAKFLRESVKGQK